MRPELCLSFDNSRTIVPAWDGLYEFNFSSKTDNSTESTYETNLKKLQIN